MGTPSPWNHFTLEELTCPCGCGRMEMDDSFMKKVVCVRNITARPMIITSGFRCPDYNAKISKTGRNGPHTTGRALDIHIYGANVIGLIVWFYHVNILNPQLHGGVGLNQQGEYHKRFLHIDDLEDTAEHPRPRVWTY